MNACVRRGPRPSANTRNEEYIALQLRSIRTNSCTRMARIQGSDAEDTMRGRDRIHFADF